MLLNSPHLSPYAKALHKKAFWMLDNNAVLYCTKKMKMNTTATGALDWGIFEGMCTKDGKAFGVGRWVCTKGGIAELDYFGKSKEEIAD